MKMLRLFFILALCCLYGRADAQGNFYFDVSTTPSSYCINCDGTATLTGVGGLAPYSFNWDNGLTGAVQTGLCSGLYSVTMTDANAATVQEYVYVDLSDIFEINIQTSKCSEQGQNNGELKVNTLGSSNFSFLWSTGATTATISGLSPGLYWVTATDDHGCSKVAQANIWTDEEPNVSISGCGSTVTIDTTGSTATSIVNAYIEFPGFTYYGSGTITGIPPGNYVYHFSSPCGSFQKNFTVGPNPNLSASITNGDCGSTNGAISLNTSSAGTAPFSYVWNTGQTTANLSNLGGGNYHVTVTDATGCSVKGDYQVLALGLHVNIWRDCSTIVAQMLDGVEPFDYYFKSPDGSVFQDAPGTPSQFNAWDFKEKGTNIVTVLDGNGCAAIDSIVTPEPVKIELYHCNSTLYASVSGAEPPLFPTWQTTGVDCSNCFSTAYDPNVVNGWVWFYLNYGTEGCAASNAVNVNYPPKCPTLITGTLYADADADCQLDPGETGMANQYVRATSVATGSNFYQSADLNGHYQIILDPGFWSLSASANIPYFNICPGNELVNLTPVDTPEVNFGFRTNILCPYTTIDMGAERLRICQNNQVVVQYCNLGTANAENAIVEVTLSPYLSLSSSTAPIVNQTGSQYYQFGLGTLQPGQCGQFSMTVFVDCNSFFNQTHCIDAHILPDSVCLPQNPQWTGAHVSLRGVCESDSVRFRIQNTGIGDMNEALDYFIVEDQIILMHDEFQLQAGQELEFALPKNGSTWHISAEQVSGHPGLDMPSLTLEGCGLSGNGAFSTGYANQFPVNDAEPSRDILCLPGLASYDPNEKTASPGGFSPQHFIQSADELEYTLYFQNTGNDTAFNVVLRDTLSALLDPMSIQPGAASHAYRFELTGQGIASFFFDNIYLPDSSTNLSASQGFVHFRIKQKANNPTGALIENKASIFFDHNPAVITNTVWHRVNDNFVVELSPVKEQPNPVATVKIYPNPFSDRAVIELTPDSKATQLKVFDLMGNLVLSIPITENSVSLQSNQLPSGIYLLRMEDKDGRILANGKAIKH